MDQIVEMAVYRPRPTDLPAFLPYACGQLEAPFRVTTLLQQIEEYGSKSEDRSKKSKRDKTTAHLATSTTEYSNERKGSEVAETRNYGDEHEVVLRMFCDSADRPLELMFFRCFQVPRLLMKILGLCIPFHPQLTKITIRWGPLDGPVLYEIAKFLPLSQITDLCLDDSPVLHRNYFQLLEQQTQLKNLSLGRCELADEDIATIAATLLHPLPASRTLATLSLESNKITDEGARHLADMLRTNRSLRHLNLAGNRLTNLGATYIFRTLVLFPVSSDEIASKKKRTFEYLKEKQATYERMLATLAATPEPPPERRRTTMSRFKKSSATMLGSFKGTAADVLAYRANAMVNELLGPLSEPFDSREIIMQDDVPYCVGNFSLCYLNLAYNELDYGCAARLAEVLAYQAERRGAGAGAGGGGGGLVRVVLEGSRGEEGRGAVEAAAAALESAVSAAAMEYQPIRSGRKSERSKIKST